MNVHHRRGSHSPVPGEVRGLLSGLFKTAEECSLKIYRSDEGIHIIHRDDALQIEYSYVLSGRDVLFFDVNLETQ